MPTEGIEEVQDFVEMSKHIAVKKEKAEMETFYTELVASLKGQLKHVKHALAEAMEHTDKVALGSDLVRTGMHVCMYACVHACMHACMYVFMHACV